MEQTIVDTELEWYEDKVARHVELDKKSSTKHTKARVAFWTGVLEDYKKGVNKKVSAPLKIKDFGSGPGKR